MLTVRQAFLRSGGRWDEIPVVFRYTKGAGDGIPNRKSIKKTEAEAMKKRWLIPLTVLAMLSLSTARSSAELSRASADAAVAY